MPTATEGEYQPHPVAPLPEGEGRILSVITAPFLTAGEGSGVRNTCSSVALAIVSRPRVVPSERLLGHVRRPNRTATSSAKRKPAGVRRRCSAVTSSQPAAAQACAAALRSGRASGSWP